jgi:hypothetical protein
LSFTIEPEFIEVLEALSFKRPVSSKDTHDLAIVVEVKGQGCDSIGKVERGEDSIIVKKSTILPVRKRFCQVVIEVESDDLSDVVYSAGSRESRFRKRYVNREKLASIPKKTMKNTIGVPVIPTTCPSSFTPIASVKFAPGKSLTLTRSGVAFCSMLAGSPPLMCLSLGS